MTQQFTASEVRDAARNYNGDTAAPLDMLRAFADLLEAQERAVPVMVVNHVSSAEHDLPIGMKLYAHPVPADAERLAEALRACALNWQEIAAATWRGYSVSASNVDKASANAYMHCAQDIRKALAAHSAQAQPPAASVTERDEDPEEHCESGDASCGPVEFHDSEGVPLCKACWDALVAENRADRENSND